MDSAAIVSAAESAAKSLGHTRLKDKQREVIVHLLSGNDVFAVLPSADRLREKPMLYLSSQSV